MNSFTRSIRNFAIGWTISLILMGIYIDYTKLTDRSTIMIAQAAQLYFFVVYCAVSAAFWFTMKAQNEVKIWHSVIACTAYFWLGFSYFASGDRIYLTGFPYVLLYPVIVSMLSFMLQSHDAADYDKYIDRQQIGVLFKALEKGYITLENLLNKSVENGKTEIILALYKKGITVENNSGLLQSAACGNSVRMIELLLQMNAKLNSQDSEGRTALIWAVLAEKPRSIETLMEHGADANIADSYGKNAADYAKEKNITL